MYYTNLKLSNFGIILLLTIFIKLVLGLKINSFFIRVALVGRIFVSSMRYEIIDSLLFGDLCMDINFCELFTVTFLFN